MAVQSFRVNLIAGSNELATPAPPYASATYAQIVAANGTLNTNRWELIYNATPSLDSSLKITGEHSSPIIVGEEKSYFSGRIRQPRDYRRAWAIESQPISYLAATYPDYDTDDIELLIATFFTADYLWANFYTPRLTGSEYYPVTVRDYSITHNDKAGTKRIKALLAHSFINL